VLFRLAEAVRQKDAQLVVVIPPSLTRSPRRLDTAVRLYDELTMSPAMQGALVLDLARTPVVAASEFVDLNHLNGIGARRLSNVVAEALRKAPRGSAGG
jgi:hypothetical protein